MASRRPEGTALLVAGHGALGEHDADSLRTLGQIGEALRATGATWQIRRLAPGAGARNTPDRGSLKQHLDDLSAEPARVAMVVVLGAVLSIAGEPALITGDRAREYPEDATLPLRWIRERLRRARAEQLVTVVSARGDDGPPVWLRALATGRPAQLVVAATSDDGHPIVEALLTALCGDALDPRTGTVTMASLSDYLARHASAAVQSSESPETLAQPPPFAGLWDVRRSQLSMRATRPRAADTEDLTGTVLPGRFRIDSLVARGTFGTVYRARQLSVERDIAVKVLHADIDPASDDGRLFVQEVRSVGRIVHPNVVGIHQADITHDGRLFFAMELLDGRDLQEVGSAGVLPRARAIELVRQLLAGLGAAHEAGLVHADVKPANAIVVERDGVERVVLVDFGLARLRLPDQPAESAGGTPAYMAPEQVQLARVDARSDLFSAALVLVYLLTGWRRPNALTLRPPPDLVPDADLRAVFARALDLDPAGRYATARELSAALTGAAAPPAPPALEPRSLAPFRQLAPLTEDDRGRLYGREADLAALTQHALYRRSVLYTAPSGTGKTSLLRAGLVPRLEALGVRAVYLRCRPDCGAALAAAIWPDGAPPAAGGPAAAAGEATTADAYAAIAQAITRWHRHRGGKLALILDQVEAALGDEGFVPAVLGFASWPADADVAVVLSIREDHLARLLDPAQTLEPDIPVVRLPPLGPDGARDAINGPLAEARLEIEPALLDVLLADLQRAASAIGPEMGWGAAPAVFPPHLQLACSVLTEELGPGEATIKLAHYQRLGGFDAIVGEHLERVLDSELTDGSDQIARKLFAALVTPAHERAMCTESELIAMIGHAERATVVLEVLRSRGLLVRVRGKGGEPSWELAHDSLVERVLAWSDARDLARRRAIELVRYHLRRSRPEAPSLLSFRELRELREHKDAVDELDAEWQRRAGSTSAPPPGADRAATRAAGSHAPASPVRAAWTPSRLVARSYQVRRREITMLAAIAGAIAIILGVAAHRSRIESERRHRDLGRFVLRLEPYNWDEAALLPIPVSPARVDLRWQLYTWDSESEHGPQVPDDDIVRGTPQIEGDALVEHVETRGGRAYLSIQRGNCAPSIVPLRDLPGYARRDHAEAVLTIPVPICAATLAGTIAIPAGKFIYGGVGDPPSQMLVREPDPAYRVERVVDLGDYRIDRTEVTNAAFAVFASMSAFTEIAAPVYPGNAELARAGEPLRPVTGIRWHVARAYCRYMGKDLPLPEQWVKAMRGGLQLPDGSENPWPRRNLPWGIGGDPLVRAQLYGSDGDVTGVANVGTHPDDASPYGVLDLAGNAQEWTSSRIRAGVRQVRGGGVQTKGLEMLYDDMAIENPREELAAYYDLGMRCAVSGRPPSEARR